MTQPGWYPDPGDRDGNNLRWWNGEKWTPETKPGPNETKENPDKEHSQEAVFETDSTREVDKEEALKSTKPQPDREPPSGLTPKPELETQNLNASSNNRAATAENLTNWQEELEKTPPGKTRKKENTHSTLKTVRQTKTWTVPRPNLMLMAIAIVGIIATVAVSLLVVFGGKKEPQDTEAGPPTQEQPVENTNLASGLCEKLPENLVVAYLIGVKADEGYSYVAVDQEKPDSGIGQQPGLQVTGGCESLVTYQKEGVPTQAKLIVLTTTGPDPLRAWQEVAGFRLEPLESANETYVMWGMQPEGFELPTGGVTKTENGWIMLLGGGDLEFKNAVDGILNSDLPPEEKEGFTALTLEQTIGSLATLTFEAAGLFTQNVSE